MSARDIVEAWFGDKIAVGPIAQYTPAYNQAFAAKADLIARLEACAQPESPAPVEAKPEPSPQPEPAAEAAHQQE